MLNVPLRHYELYLDLQQKQGLGPQVTSQNLSGLQSGRHYVQVVARQPPIRALLPPRPSTSFGTTRLFGTYSYSRRSGVQPGCP